MLTIAAWQKTLFGAIAAVVWKGEGAGGEAGDGDYPVRGHLLLLGRRHRRRSPRRLRLCGQGLAHHFEDVVSMAVARDAD